MQEDTGSREGAMWDRKQYCTITKQAKTWTDYLPTRYMPWERVTVGKKHNKVERMDTPAGNGLLKEQERDTFGKFVSIAKLGCHFQNMTTVRNRKYFKLRSVEIINNFIHCICKYLGHVSIYLHHRWGISVWKTMENVCENQRPQNKTLPGCKLSTLESALPALLPQTQRRHHFPTPDVFSQVS